MGSVGVGKGLRRAKKAPGSQATSGGRQILATKEDREEDDALDESSENDRDLEDVGSSTWVAAGGFSSLHSEESNADTRANSCETNVKLAFEGSEEEHKEFSHFFIWFGFGSRHPR